MLLALVMTVALGQDGVLRSDLKAWNAGPGIELGKKKAAEKLKELETLLAAVKKAKVSSKIDKAIVRSIRNRIVVALPDAKSKQETIDRLKQEIEQLKSQIKSGDYPPEYPELSYERLTIGRIGYLVHENFGNPMTFQVLQIVDEDNLIADIPTSRFLRNKTVWITTKTAGMTDDSIYECDQSIYEVVGTKQYVTVTGGTKTLLHLVQRSADELAK